MKFSRRATSEDFIGANEKWRELLHPSILDEYHNGNKAKAVLTHRSYHACGVQVSKDVIDRYSSFLDAWNDFIEGKEIFVQY